MGGVIKWVMGGRKECERGGKSMEVYNGGKRSKEW
jgi:hypothetical protein